MGEPRVLIKSLENCEKECKTCAGESLNNKDVLSLEECIRLARDCADFCHLAIKLLKRNSARKNEIIAMRMVICSACAEECEKHDPSCCQKCAGSVQRVAVLILKKTGCHLILSKFVEFSFRGIANALISDPERESRPYNLQVPEAAMLLPRLGKMNGCR